MCRVVIIILFVSIFLNASAQNHSLGLRLGNPFGIVFKEYLPNNKALEFGIGTIPSGWNSNYYHRAFDDHSQYKDKFYYSHHVEGTVYFQGRYLFQYKIPTEGMMGALGWYWGMGAVVKLASVKYSHYTPTPSSASSLQAPDTDTKLDIDLGPEGIGGAEYTFRDVPITLFGEISLMAEFVDDPVNFRLLFGTGGRFRF